MAADHLLAALDQLRAQAAAARAADGEDQEDLGAARLIAAGARQHRADRQAEQRERRVADDSPRSNARLVRERLLQNRAKAASFTPLADVRLPEDQELAAASARIAHLPAPADVVVRGMGDDGHTASWFPGAGKLAEAMDPAARQLVVPIAAPDAPEPRLTLTGRVILRARAIALEIQGDGKRATFAAALEPGPEQAMPIRAVLRGAADRLTVFMALRTDSLPDPAVAKDHPA